MFNSANSGYSLSDIAAVAGGNEGFGFGNGNGVWWIILFFLVMFGGWGNGGWGNNGQNAADDISYNFDINGLDNGIRNLTSDTAAGFYRLNTSLLTGFAGMNSTIANANNDILMAINGNTVAGMQNTNALTALMS